MPIYAPVLRWFARQTVTDPAITQIDVAGAFSLPASFSLGAHDGLLAVEVVRGDGASRVLALWRDRTARDLRQNALATAFDGTIAWGGEVLEVRKPRSWKLVSVSDTALKVIGALTVVMALLSSWFAAPNVVFVPEPPSLDVGVGERFAFGVSALNNDRSNAVDVTFTLRASQPGVNLSATNLVVPPGGRGVVAITGTISRAGRAVIEVDASTKSGRFVPADNTLVRATVRVWPGFDKTVLERQQSDNLSLHTMQFHGDVGTGDPGAKALRCEATIVNAPATLRFVTASPTLDGGGTPVESGEGPQRAIGHRFSVPVARRFADIGVTLTLENDGPVEELAAVKLQPTLNCEVVR